METDRKYNCFSPSEALLVFSLSAQAQKSIITCIWSVCMCVLHWATDLWCRTMGDYQVSEWHITVPQRSRRSCHPEICLSFYFITPELLLYRTSSVFVCIWLFVCVLFSYTILPLLHYLTQQPSNHTLSLWENVAQRGVTVNLKNTNSHSGWLERWNNMTLAFSISLKHALNEYFHLRWIT